MLQYVTASCNARGGERAQRARDSRSISSERSEERVSGLSAVPVVSAAVLTSTVPKIHWKTHLMDVSRPELTEGITLALLLAFWPCAGKEAGRRWTQMKRAIKRSF